MTAPEHIAIIPDGNRRFAKRLLERPWKGHEWGAGKIRELVGWCKEKGVRVITIYSLSLENLNSRPKDEIRYLMALAKKELRDILDNKRSFVHQYKVGVAFFGNLEKLPEDVQKLMADVTKKTKIYSNMFLNFAVAYGGKQEILEAVTKIGRKTKKGLINPEKITEKIFRRNLQTNGFKDPDLIIRTGGEKRLSNFLSFQSAYSELAFVDSLWPEFSKKEFFQVIGDFEERERRFGK